MVRGDLVKLIGSYLSQGYASDQIREGLLAQGWSPDDVSSALSEAQSMQTSARKTWVFVAVIALVVVVFIAASLYFIMPSQPSQLLDVSIEPVKTEIPAGSQIDFIIQLVNLGRARRFDVHLKSELVSVTTNEVVSTKTETVAIETRNAIRTHINVPDDVKPGRFVVRTMAEYEDQSARASFTVRVVEPSQQKQDPEQVSPPSSIVDCQGGCNDYDPCTKDRCSRGVCVFDRLSPCCGNRLCEPQESPSTCPEDCQSGRPSITESVKTITDRAFESARTDPQSAARTCKTMARLSDVDSCLSGVSKRSGSVEVCNAIITVKEKDGCYLEVALSRDRFDVCDKIDDRWLKSSCFSYKNLKSQGK